MSLYGDLPSGQSLYMSKLVQTLRDFRFRHEVDEYCALLGHYAASGGNFVPTFLNDLSVPSSRVKNFGFLTLEVWGR